MSSDYQPPQEAMTPFTHHDLMAWQALTDETAPRTQATAAAWRTGLAGFITLVTSALIFKGPEIGEVGSPAKWVIIGLLVFGIAASVIGLWFALRAEAPRQGRISFDTLIEEHHSIKNYTQYLADRSTEALNKAKWLVGIALALFVAGSVIWWSSPTASPKPSKLRITTTEASPAGSICGEALEAPAGQVLIKVNDATTPTAVNLTDIESLKLVNSCS